MRTRLSGGPALPQPVGDGDELMRETGPDFIGSTPHDQMVIKVREAMRIGKQRFGMPVQIEEPTVKARALLGASFSGGQPRSWPEASAEVNSYVKYERGNGRIRLQLARRDGKWKIARFDILPADG